MALTAEKTRFGSRLASRHTDESVYTADPLEFGLSSAEIERARRRPGGATLTPASTTQLRWYPADVESASVRADGGDLSMAARLWTASRHDGVTRGVLSTRTNGLVRLPKVFTGNPQLIARLQDPHAGVRSLFDEMFPPQELAGLLSDGLGCGVGVGELVPVKGRDFPILVRQEPEFLRWDRTANRWYFMASVGRIPITPGDGRWILHVPGGRVNPWRNGLWAAVGEPWIRKTHAAAYDNNWISKLANPARVAQAPSGATAKQRQNFFRQVMRWTINSVFGLPPGWEIKLLESNGRGWESFDRTIKRSEREIIIAIAGQEITTDGGSGFQNNDIHQTIKADLIQSDAEQLAFTINTQALPAWVNHIGGPEDEGALVHWDVTPAEDRKALGDAYRMVGVALRALGPELARHGMKPDVRKIVDRMGLPVIEDANALAEHIEFLAATGGSGSSDEGADE